MLRKKVIEVKKAEEKLLSELVTKEVKIVGEINKLEWDIDSFLLSSFVSLFKSYLRQIRSFNLYQNSK